VPGVRPHSAWLTGDADDAADRLEAHPPAAMATDAAIRIIFHMPTRSNRIIRPQRIAAA